MIGQKPEDDLIKPITVSTTRRSPALPSGGMSAPSPKRVVGLDDPTPTYRPPAQAKRVVSLDDPIEEEEYSFEKARQNPALLTSVRRYYKNIEGKVFKEGLEGDDKAFEYWKGDRRWKDANTWSTLAEMGRVTGKMPGVKLLAKEDAEDLAVIRAEWEKIPGGIQRMVKAAGSGDMAGVFEAASAIGENVVKGLVDPTIVVGPVAGKVAGQFAKSAAARVVAGVTADAAVTAGASAAYQSANVQLGLQEEVDKATVALSGGLGAVTSAPSHYLASAGGKAGTVSPKQALEQAEKGASKLREAGVVEPGKGLYDTQNTSKMKFDEAWSAAQKDIADASAVSVVAKNKETSFLRTKNAFKGKVQVYGEQGQDAPDFGLKAFGEKRVEGAPKTELEFSNAFVLTPKNVKEAKKLIGIPEEQLVNGSRLAEGLRELGYDGLVIRGFDEKFAPLQKKFGDKSQQYIDEVAGKLGLTPAAARNAVVPFGEAKPTPVKGLKDLVASGPKTTPEQTIADAVNQGATLQKVDPDLEAKLADPVTLESTLASKLGLPPQEVKTQSKKILDYIGGAMFKYNTSESAIDQVAAIRDDLVGALEVSASRVGRVSWAASKEAAAKGVEKTGVEETIDVLSNTPNDYAVSAKEKFAFDIAIAVASKQWQDAVEKAASNPFDLEAQLLSKELQNKYTTLVTKKDLGISEAARAVRSAASDPTSQGFLNKTMGVVRGAINKTTDLIGMNTEQKFLIKKNQDKVSAAKKVMDDYEAQAAKLSAAYEKIKQRQTSRVVAGLNSQAEALMRQAERAFTKAAKAKEKFEQVNRDAVEELREKAGLDFDPKLQKEIFDSVMDLQRRGDPLVTDLFLQNLQNQGVKTSDQIWELWYNSLLSGIPTQVVNFAGNLGIAAGRFVEDTYGAVAVGADPRQMMTAYVSGLSKATGAFMKTFKTEVPQDLASRLELKYGGQAIPSYIFGQGDNKFMGFRYRKAGIGEGGWGGKQVRLPGRFLMAMDDFFKAIHYETGKGIAAIQEIAQEQASTGIALTKQEFRQRFIDKTTNPSTAANEYARELSRVMTLTSEGGQIERHVAGLVDAIPGGRLAVPFVRTPGNILKRAYDMVGWNSERNKSDRLAGGIRKKQAEARLAMGYGLLGLSMGMAYAGLATGAGPTERGEREVWSQSYLPWSVNIGGTWVQVNRFDPAAMVWTIGAGLGEVGRLINDPVREQAALDTMAQLFSTAILDKSYFQGIQNVVEAATNVNGATESLVNSIGRTFVPSIVASAARAYDPRTTAPNTFMEVLQDRIGFEARTKVPSRYDYRGREVPIEVWGADKDTKGLQGFLGRFISPVKIKSDGDFIDKEMSDLRVSIPRMPDKWKGVELSSEQLAVYTKAKGQMMDDFLRFMMEDEKEWKALDKGFRREIIQDAIMYSNDAAEGMLLGVYPEINDLVYSETRNRELKKYSTPTLEELHKTPLFRTNPILQKEQP